VVGVVLIVVAMVLVLPVGVMVAGAVWSALTGFVYSGEPDAEPPTS
jgi:hypothetical protein